MLVSRSVSVVNIEPVTTAGDGSGDVFRSNRDGRFPHSAVNDGGVALAAATAAACLGDTGDSDRCDCWTCCCCCCCSCCIE